MRSKPRWYSILFIALALLLASSVVGCAPNPRYIYENGAINVGGDREPIELINNPNATNPTYAELVAFIKTDTTDTKDYIDESWRALNKDIRPYVCADFAEDVHNNAEAAGIRAAWVGIDLEGDDEGHALNAFETTDRGLVYIDCTGGYFIEKALKKHHTSWDAVAYVEIGKEYGLIDIAKAKSLSYSFYEEYKQKWQLHEKLLSDYNEEVRRYNQEIKGKVYYEGSPELAGIEAWEARLEAKSRLIDELSEELGDLWFESVGVVEDIHIHWGGGESTKDIYIPPPPPAPSTTLPLVPPPPPALITPAYIWAIIVIFAALFILVTILIIRTRRRVMKRTYHPEADAVGACANCGRLICAECKTVLGGKIYCNPCADKLFTRASTTYKAKGLNWFERHLNWTAVLSWLALYPITFVVGYIVGFIVVSIDPYISDEALDGLGYLAGIVVSLAWILPTNGWILKKKSRSLWNLLWLIIPFGWLVFLCFENQSHLPKLANNEHEREKEWAEFTALPEISKGNYVANKKTRTFHYPHCYKAEHISYENAVWFESSADAIIEGYEPCKLCKPELEE